MAHPRLAALAAAAALALPAAASDVVAEAAMPRCCVGMASAEVGIGPQKIEVGPVTPRRTASFVGGRFTDAGGEPQTFGCRGREKDVFKLVELLEAVDDAAVDDMAGDERSAAEGARMGAFDATGRIPCAAAVGQPIVPCDFGVAREAGGGAAVIATRPDRTGRALFFADGDFLSADAGQADGCPNVASERNAGLFPISVGQERCEAPEAEVFGG